MPQADIITLLRLMSLGNQNVNSTIGNASLMTPNVVGGARPLGPIITPDLQQPTRPIITPPSPQGINKIITPDQQQPLRPITTPPSQFRDFTETFPREEQRPTVLKSEDFPSAREEEVFARPDFFGKGKPGIGTTTENPSSDRPLLRDQNKKAIIFRDKQGNPKGVISFAIKDDGALETRKDFGANAEIFVSPEFRRKGIATKLFDKAKELGFDIDTLQGLSFTTQGKALQKSRLNKLQKSK